MTTPSIPSVLIKLPDFVASMREKHQLPALSIAVWHQGKLHRAASGILNNETQVEATPDAIFQIGSISKIFTTSLIMLLVDEGKLELDKPLKQYLRDFQIADADITENVTVAQLLDHSSGIAGDFLPSLSHTEENAIARFVDRCNLLPAAHPRGERHSYSNGAFNIAGRLIEVLMGCSWFEAIEERIFKPLGMKQAIAHPSQAIRYRAAMGHVPSADDPEQLQLSPYCYLPNCWAPAGATISMSASDLMIFAQAHLNKGLNAAGEVWLSADSVAYMQRYRISLPACAAPTVTDWALGWQINNLSSTVIGHGGVVSGQNAELQLIPSHNTAFAILQNRVKSAAIVDMTSELLAALCDVEFPSYTPQQDLEVANIERLQGAYSTVADTADVILSNGQLTLQYRPADWALVMPRYELQPINETTFAAYNNGVWEGNVVFLDLDEQGTPSGLYWTFRYLKRQADQP